MPAVPLCYKHSWASWRVGVKGPFFALFSEKSALYFVSFKRKGNEKMKRKITLAILLLLTVSALLISCSDTDPWASATYKEDTTLGTGAKSVTVLIECGENAIALTLNTDALTVGAALFELELINDPSFFDVLNGVLASWEKDNAYWAFYVGGQLASVGVDDVEIVGGESFKFVYTK